MRKSLILLCLIAGLALAPVTANAAPSDLRDPFDPLLGNEAEEATGAEDPTTTDPTAEDPSVIDDPDPVPPGDGLPSTGSDTRDWLAAAYLLIVAGTGLTAVARVARPPRKRVLP